MNKQKEIELNITEVLTEPNYGLLQCIVHSMGIGYLNVDLDE
jgi:hypothetical protein